MQKTTPQIQGNCHPIAHMIGAGGLRHFDGQVGKAFVVGLQHVRIRLLPRPPRSGSSPVSRRTKPPRSRARRATHPRDQVTNNFNYYQCEHGLGHGLMLYTGSSCPLALDDVPRPPRTSSKQVSCSGGVFMENLQLAVRRSARAGSRRTTCSTRATIVSPPGQALLLPARLLATSSPRWAGSGSGGRLVPQELEQDFVDICFQSYGRDASGAATQNPGREGLLREGRQRRA